MALPTCSFLSSGLQLRFILCQWQPPLLQASGQHWLLSGFKTSRHPPAFGTLPFQLKQYQARTKSIESPTITPWPATFHLQLLHQIQSSSICLRKQPTVHWSTTWSANLTTSTLIWTPSMNTKEEPHSILLWLTLTSSSQVVVSMRPLCVGQLLLVPLSSQLPNMIAV